MQINETKEGQIDILNAELKRELVLTKQDLRFVDYLLKMVEIRDDSAVWEGSDDWIRCQFQMYLLNMLAAAKIIDISTKSEECNETKAETPTNDEFNIEFLKAWKSKHNYRVWSCTEHENFSNISPR